MKGKILIADDEQRIRKLVGDFLKKEGYRYIEAENGKEALALFEDQMDFDLLILDIMMPEIDGLSVCKEIRKTSQVPILMLTARSMAIDELYGFESGVDEYVTKPFNPQILMARINALIKRSSPQKVEAFEYETFHVDFSARIVTVNDKAISMSPREYDLLVYMIENAGQSLSREQILNKVWGYDYYGDARTVDTHITRIRSKLEEYGTLITTIRGYGYRFEVKQ